MLSNSVLTPVGDQAPWLPGRCRFLGLDSNGAAVVIPLDRKTVGPIAFSHRELEQAVADGGLKIEPPSEQPVGRAPDDLSTKARAFYDAWEPHFISLLRGDQRDRLLQTSFRATLIATMSMDTGKPEITVRRVLYRVMRAGLSLRGLAPDFHLRGAPGKPQAKGTRRRGRKPKPGSIASAISLPDVRAILVDTAKQRVIKQHESIDAAYTKMLAEHFSELSIAVNGTVKRRLFEEFRLPTRAQFHRIVKLVADDGLPSKKAKIRALPGSAKEGIPGPGYLYEIDATGSSLELVSEFDLSQSIGPAAAYGLLDVWSTACVGGVMGVFHASYRAAQMAFFNAFTNKCDLCARWDIDLPEEAWPCEHVPRLVTSDRGELVGDAAEALPLELNITLQTAAAYRPEMKGTIERWFRDFKAGDIRKLVGFGRKTHRGERNPKEQAALTRYDAMRAFLLLAIRHNHQPAPEAAIPPQMVEDGYETISRITLWQWGMQNLVSGARREDPGVIYTGLLRKVDATIRENGLFVDDVRYMSPELRVSGLLQRASRTGSIGVQATVDDFAARIIWYRTGLDAPWSPAYLADEKLRMYDATFAEVADYYRRRRTIHLRTRVHSAVSDYATETHLKTLSSSAVARQGGKKVARRPENVRRVRAIDAQDEGREHGARVVGSYLPKPMTKRRRNPETQPHDSRDPRLELVRRAFLVEG